MEVLTKREIYDIASRGMKRCANCIGCSKVTSSGQCEHKCDKWFSLRIKELTQSQKVKAPNFV